MQSNDEYVKVFDILDSGFKTWHFSAFGLIFIAVGLAIVFGPKILAKLGVEYIGFQSKSYKIFAIIFLVFSLFWTGTAFYCTYSKYQNFKTVAENGTCKLVEGTVENFDPMPYSGHKNESYTVNGVEFSYSDFSVSDAFNNTVSHGGPVKEGSEVRICYTTLGNTNHILRLEIKGYQGPIKDYSKPDNLLPPISPPKDNQFKNFSKVDSNPVASILFILVIFLDYYGLIKMQPSYLQTYFRVRRTDRTNVKPH